jgi:hypothetical protein
MVKKEEDHESDEQYESRQKPEQNNGGRDDRLDAPFFTAIFALGLDSY